MSLHRRRAYLYRAIDQEGQVMDVYFSERRNAGAAESFVKRATGETGVQSTRVTTDRAKSYPRALKSVLPDAQHRCSQYLHNGLERDHEHLKQRLRPIRGFKCPVSADILSRGHALIRNLRSGFSTLTADVPHTLRLATT